MGIPGFNTWFYENNKQAYVPLQQLKVDHLYVDMNSLLHNALRNARNLDHYHEVLYKRMDRLLNVTQPRKSVMLAIDGPAPLAKLMTQRERRKKSFVSEERKKGNGSGSQQSSGNKRRSGSFTSSTALTPGTPFMHDVCVSISHFVCAKLGQDKWRHLEFEVSGPTVAGEGEVKVLGRLARPRDATAVTPDDTHMIVGDDADLILMALVSSTPRLHILNASLTDSPSSKHKPQLGPQSAVLSVDKLHAVWLAAGVTGKQPQQQQVHKQHHAQKAQGQPQQQQQQQEQILGRQELLELLGSKADLALLAILSNGNDYLPAVKGCSKLDDLWTSYKQVRQRPEFADRSIITMVQQEPHNSSSNGGDQAVSRDLAQLAELDAFMLAEVMAVAQQGYSRYYGVPGGKKKRRKQTQQQQQQQQEDGDTGEEVNTGAVAAAAAAAAAGSKSSDVALTREAAESLAWVKGLLWTMSMYFAGDCPDYRWCFAGGAPSSAGLTDLAITAAAAAGSNGSSSAPRPQDAVLASAHLRIRLSDFAAAATNSSSSSALTGPSGAAFSAAVAAAYQQQVTRVASRGRSAAAAVAGAGGLEALPPHVCSLALLPPGALEHVPAAVQHLMAEGSPVYDMYESCPVCEQLGKTVYDATVAHQAAINKTNELARQIAARAKVEGRRPASAGAAAATVAAGAVDVDGTATTGVKGTEDTEGSMGMETDCEAAAAAAAAAVGGGAAMSYEMASLLGQQEAAQAERDARKAVMLVAQEERRKHEVKDHPQGVDTFDLARLEGAVSSIPASAYKGEQQALTQVSQSMVFRVLPYQQQQQQYPGYGAGQQQQQQQQYPGYGAGQQQQQYRGYQQQTGVVGSLFRPPPPAFRGSYTAASSRNAQVLRSVLSEDAFSCVIQEDRHMWRYSKYLVIGAPPGNTNSSSRPPSQGAPAGALKRTGSGTAAAAAGRGAAAGGGAGRQQLPRTGSGAAAKAGTAAAAGAAAAQAALSGRPSDTAEPMDIDATAAAFERTDLNQQQQGQQRQPRSPKSKRGRESSSAGAAAGNAAQSSQAAMAAAAAAAAAAAQHLPKPSGRQGIPSTGGSRGTSSPQRKRQDRTRSSGAGGTPPPGPSASMGGYGLYAVGLPPPPAPKNVPLPGGLLGRRAGSGVGLAGSGGSGGVGSTGAYDSSAAAYNSSSHPAGGSYESGQQNYGGAAGGYGGGSYAAAAPFEGGQGTGYGSSGAANGGYGVDSQPAYESYDNQPGGYSSQPDGYSQPAGYSSYPGEQPGNYSSQPDGYSGHPGSYCSQPDGYNGQPGSYSGQPGGYNAQAAVYEGQYGSQQYGGYAAAAPAAVAAVPPAIPPAGPTVGPPHGGYQAGVWGAAAGPAGGAGASGLPQPVRPVPPPAAPHVPGPYATVQHQWAGRGPPHLGMQGWPRP